MCVRVLGEHLTVKKLLASLHMLEGSMTNKHIAAEVMDVLTKKMGIEDRVCRSSVPNMFQGHISSAAVLHGRVNE